MNEGAALVQLDHLIQNKHCIFFFFFERCPRGELLMLLWVGAQMHTSSWSVLASLFLAFVLWSRQGRGSRKLLEFMMRISPFQHPERDQRDILD